MNHDLTHAMLITMVAAISAGVLLITLSRRINISAIVLLLLGGIGLGPEGLDIVHADSLGDGLSVIVSLAIGLILFEGGLTLNLHGYRSAPAVIRRLLSVGMLTTWLVTAASVWLVFRFDPSFSLLAASLVVVTGPTVISPLLKRVKVRPRLHSILHWEGVLIDPIGVFVAILCYEWLGDQGRDLALVRFVLRFIWGVGLGLAGGLAVDRIIRSRFVSDDMMNVFALASAVLIFGLGESLFSESGLLAVTVSGFVLGLKRPGELKKIRQFKAEITDLLIGTLFILLASRLELGQFSDFGAGGLLLVGMVLLLARPLNILISSWGLGLTWREKGFLTWVAPRGIVAASMASLFTLSIQQRSDMPNAAFLETFTYSIIVITVLIQGLTVGVVARILKVERPAPTGWLIVGANLFGRRIARFISKGVGRQVALIDTNPQAVADARAEGLTAILDDARDPELEEQDELQGIGNLLALTDNEDLNMLLCQRWSENFGKDHVFFWGSGHESTREFTGQTVWTRLPKPTHLSGELERGEAILLELSEPPHDADDLALPILFVRNGQVRLNPSLATGLDGGRLDAALLLRREADYLCASLRPERILRLDASSREDLFVRLVDWLAQSQPDLSGDEVVRDLLDRENVFCSSLGHGIAVPHAYTPALTSRICAVAQVPDGVDFGALDGEPVRLVFLVLSPPEDPEGHIETIAEIARMVGHSQTRDRLLAAQRPADLMDTIQRATVA